MKRRPMSRLIKCFLLSVLTLGVVLPMVSDFGAAAPDEFRAKPVMNKHVHRSIATKRAEAFPFLNVQAANLNLVTEPNSFEAFYRKLEQSLYNNGEAVNIVHMGGSHVQAGMIGHQMRTLFNDLHRNSVSERGLIVPFRVGKTNSTVYTGSSATGDWEGCRCAARKDACTWGLTGFTLLTETDSAAIQTWAFDQDSALYTGDLVRVYHRFQPGQMKLIWGGEQEALHVTRDSLNGFTEFQFDQAVDTLKFVVRSDSLHNKGFELHGFWLGAQQSTGGIRYHEIGVNGASTASFLRCQQMGQQMKSLSPDLVIFGIGVNDAHGRPSNFSTERFIQRYDSLVGIVRADNPEAALLFLTNSDNYYRGRPNVNGLEVQKAMHHLAEKHRGAVWDLFEVMGGLGSIYDWQRAGLARNDKIHFTKAGYELQAELMYLALTDGFSNYLINRYATVHELDHPLLEAE